MKAPAEMDKLVELYTYYLVIGVCAILFVIILLLIGYFIFNILSLISIAG